MAIPLHKFATLDPSLVAGKLVIDVMNYPVFGVSLRRTEFELAT